MKRRSKQRMTAIHMSIPVRLLEEFDRTLRYNQSRSAKICTLVEKDLNDALSTDLYSSTDSQLIRHLVTRDCVDDTLAHLLLQVLTKQA